MRLSRDSLGYPRNETCYALYTILLTVQPATLTLYNSLVPAPSRNTLFVEDPIAVWREFLRFLS